MKKILSIALMAVALTVVSGCSKNEYGKWDTLITRYLSPSISEADAEIIKGCISEVEYFNTPHAYEGYHDDCLGKAITEFATAADLVDGAKIRENLRPGEKVTLTLIFRAEGSSEGEMAAQAYWTYTL